MKRSDELSVGDIAGKDYWDGTWGAAHDLPPPLQPAREALGNYVTRAFHSFFAKSFASTKTSGASLLEIGCAQSVWLPYFAREFDFRISGLDYSQTGIAQAKAVLDREGLSAHLVCADLYAPPAAERQRYDVVVSFGVAEHFEDTAGCLRAMAALLRPGGKLITIVPNMCGAIGFVERMVNRSVFDKHVLLDREAMARASTAAGLVNVSAEYLICSNFGVCNLNGLPPSAMTSCKSVLLKALLYGSAGLWLIDSRVARLPVTKLLSAYVVSVAHCAE